MQNKTESKSLKVWIDSARPAPNGYVWKKSVNETIKFLKAMHKKGITVDLLDMGHDAGVYIKQGGSYLEILTWLEKEHMSIPIRIHSLNPIKANLMVSKARKNKWTLVR